MFTKPNQKLSQALDILRRVIPWALETNSTKSIYRKNYKGVRGRIGIVGGARDYAGAPYFASISSMRLGADLSYVICSKNAAQSIKNYSPDLIVMPLLDSDDENEFNSEINCLFDRLHALVIGPGLGREKLLQDRAKKLIEMAKLRKLPLVLDADSLILINENPNIIKSYSKALLTPNRVELQRLSNTLFAPQSFDLRNMSTNDITDLVDRCSKVLDVSILAKGSIDIISQPCGFQLTTDESFGSNRRCGGQGDILAGLAGVYLHWICQSNEKDNEERKINNELAWAAYLAAITTRLANELAYIDFKNGMLASHMIDKVSIALDSMLSMNKTVTQLEEEAGRTASFSDKKVLIDDVKYFGSLSQDEIKRYTRQMIMDEFGPERQLNLKKSSAIIIGAGGLGCPAAIYLAAGGMGRLGIVDDDRVESSNLHRQILHNVNKLGMLKTESIKKSLLDINPNVVVDTYSTKFTRENAVKMIETYDMVIDATDNLMTRYMISDACVVAKKPLISGAALKMDGQLTVYNYSSDTPCFRCLFPEPPPPASVGSCSDNGVLGVIPGIIGIQQALEAIKIGSGLKPANAGKMLLFDGQSGLFRHITLGKRKHDCEACGTNSKLSTDLIDYDEFCGQFSCEGGGNKTNSDILDKTERITPEEYLNILNLKEKHVLIDVRPTIQSDVSRFSHALQIPIVKMLEKKEESFNIIDCALRENNTNSIYVVCRKGIASQRGTRIIQDLFKASNNSNVIVKDIIGGMTAWSKNIDPDNYSCL